MDLLTKLLVFLWSVTLISAYYFNIYGPDDSNDKAFNAEKDVIFRLYTKGKSNISDYEVIRNRNEQNLTKSRFDKSKPVKIIIHGFNTDGLGLFCEQVMGAFLKVLDVNVICVDWGKGAKTTYLIAKGHVSQVGDHVANFINWLIGRGSRLKDFHLIGHSLGAHASGRTGRFVENGKLPYITVLDAAGPLWTNNSERVNTTDALYVEAIHTDGKRLGYFEALGHNDFYPNGGEHQPGCDSNDEGCSHSRAYMLYAASIDNENFAGIRCKDEEAARKGDCDGPEILHMGGSRPKPKKGIFHLKTKDKPPYYIGD